MHLSFLNPRVERLGSDGVFTTLSEGSPLGRLRRPVVLLGRDLCAFSFFEAQALPRGRRREAARLHARVASPYVVGGTALVRAGADFGIWWWDLERVSPWLQARFGRNPPVARPESLALAAGQGWRILRLDHGYEAQLWRGGDLVASAWRREPFDARAWAGFTRLQRDAPPAPAEPPTPEHRPIDPGSVAFSLESIEVTREQALGMAAGGFATVAVSVAAFFLGQGLQLSRSADEILRETEEIRQSTPRPRATVVEADRQKLIAYREIEERTNPVSATGAAIGIFAIYDLVPGTLSVTDGVLSATTGSQAAEKSDELVAEFEQSGYFYDVAPRLDEAAGQFVIEMKIRDAAPPLTGGE